jgi:hypothetical protein
MSESNPITGVVSSLKTVRDQYQQQLQNVPQYATYLRVQQLTEISPVALGIAAGTEGFSTAHDVVAALAFARDKFKEHLASVPEYRALVAIDKLITDLDVAAQPETATTVETAPEAVAEPAQETVAPVVALEDHPDASAAGEALPNLSSAPEPAATEAAAATETAAAVADTPVFGAQNIETHGIEENGIEENGIETPAIETAVIETAVIETTVGEVTFAHYPDAPPAAEQAAAETPAENTGAERAA